MILISAGLGSGLLAALSFGRTIQEVLRCSNTPSLNAFNWPLYNLSDPGIQNLSGKAVPGSTQETVLAVNFFVAAIQGTGGPPGAALFCKSVPCWRNSGNRVTKIFDNCGVARRAQNDDVIY
jgi:hypothetical protein